VSSEQGGPAPPAGSRVSAPSWFGAPPHLRAPYAALAALAGCLPDTNEVWVLLPASLLLTPPQAHASASLSNQVAAEAFKPGAGFWLLSSRTKGHRWQW
jgi:hypothetical protein